MVGRVTVSDVLAAVGGIALFVAVEFVDRWYQVGAHAIAPVQIQADPLYLAQLAPPRAEALRRPEPFGAWKDQGVEGSVANYVMLIGAIAAIVTAVLGVAGREAGAWRTIRLPLAVAALAAVALRMVFLPETQIGGRKFSDYELEFGIFIALGGALVMTIGAALGAMGRGDGPPEGRGSLLR